MALIKHYRPGGLEIEISEGNTVKLMMVRENPNHGIIARIRGYGRKVLWGVEDAAEHRNDTDQQFIDRIKELY